MQILIWLDLIIKVEKVDETAFMQVPSFKARRKKSVKRALNTGIWGSLTTTEMIKETTAHISSGKKPSNGTKIHPSITRKLKVCILLILYIIIGRVPVRVTVGPLLKLIHVLKTISIPSSRSSEKAPRCGYY